MGWNAFVTICVHCVPRALLIRHPPVLGRILIRFYGFCRQLQAVLRGVTAEILAAGASDGSGLHGGYIA